MPELKLVEGWAENCVAIADRRLPSGPLALHFYEGFPTQTPRWIVGDLPQRLGYELDRPTGSNPAPVRVANWLEADEQTVTIRTTVTNEGDAIIDKIVLNPCLAFCHCTEMADETGERLYFRRGGEWRNWTQLRRYVHAGWHERVQNFEVHGKPSYVPYTDEGYNQGNWGTSPDRLDVSVAARVHPESGLAVAIAFDRSHSACANGNADHYCIHSHGLISDLCPGDTRVRTGKIFFCAGGLEEVWERYQKELTAFN